MYTATIWEMRVYNVLVHVSGGFKGQNVTHNFESVLTAISNEI